MSIYKQKNQSSSTSKQRGLLQRSGILVSATMFAFAAFITTSILAPESVSAACTAPSTNYGNVTSSIAVPQDGTYRVWTRMKVPNTTDNTVLLEVDGNGCYNIGGSSVKSGAWTWVDYKSGGAKLDLTLKAGSHTVKFIGNKPDVMLDRIILTADTNCVPDSSSVGDNCANPADTTAPTVSLTKPTANAEVKDTMYLAVDTKDDDGGTGVAKVEYYVDGKLYKTAATGAPTYERSLDTTTLPNGTHKVVAKAYDGAGNSASSGTVSFTILNPDTVAPTVTLQGITAGQTVTDKIAVEALPKDNEAVTKVDFEIDGKYTKTEVNSPYCMTESKGNCVGWDVTTLSNGVHTLKAIAYDAAGNKGSDSVSFIVKNTDTVAPTVSLSGVSEGAIVTGSIVAEAKAADNVGVSKVDFLVDNEYVQTQVNPPFCMAEQSGSCVGWDITSLSDGLHNLTATAFDEAGNKASATVTFTVKNADTKAPNLTIKGLANGSTVSGAVTIEADATDNDAIAKVDFSIDGTYSKTEVNPPYCMQESTGSCVGWDTSVLTNGAHSLRVAAYDLSGNMTVKTVSFTVQNGDTQAPSVPSSVRAIANSYNRVTVSWAASSDNKGIDRYCVVRNDGKTSCVAGSSTSFVDSAVVPHTSYTYSVGAYDAANNFSGQSAAVSVKTPDAPDTSAPSVPSNVQAKVVSASQINLSWTASTDNIGVASYDVYRNGSKIASVGSTSYGDTNLSASTTYTYTVQARDAAGNLSDKSYPVKATTETALLQMGEVYGAIDADKGKVYNPNISLDVGGFSRYYSPGKVGKYLIQYLPPATYIIRYNAPKFKAQDISTRVNENSTLEQNVTLIRK